MAESHKILSVLVYTAGASITASLGVLFVGSIVFGFQFAAWTERQGELLGVVGTIAGVVGAAIGLRRAVRAQRRAAHH